MRSAHGDLEAGADQQRPQQPLEASWEVRQAENNGDGGSERSLLVSMRGAWGLFVVDKKGDGP